MHFTKKALFWQCMESQSSESYPYGLSQTAWDNTEIGHELVMKRKAHEFRQTCSSDESTRNSILDGWLAFIMSYSKSALTRESDIFVALHGISQDVVVDTLEDRMVAGLLESRLREELCWCISSVWWNTKLIAREFTTHRPQKWRAPSWSWASTTAPIRSWANIIPGTQHNTCTVLKYHVPTKPSGELMEASLWIECRLLSLKIECVESIFDIRIPGIDHKESPWGTYISMDDITFGLYDHMRYVQDVYLLTLYYYENGPGEGDGLRGLLLVADRTGSGRFRRIGFLEVRTNPSSGEKCDDAEDRFERIMGMLLEAESQVIELV
jgi:hypothetical protein